MAVLTSLPVELDSTFHLGMKDLPTLNTLTMTMHGTVLLTPEVPLQFVVDRSDIVLRSHGYHGHIQWNLALWTPPKSGHLHNVDTFKCPND